MHHSVFQSRGWIELPGIAPDLRRAALQAILDARTVEAIVEQVPSATEAELKAALLDGPQDLAVCAGDLSLSLERLSKQFRRLADVLSEARDKLL